MEERAAVTENLKYDIFMALRDEFGILPENLDIEIRNLINGFQANLKLELQRDDIIHMADELDIDITKESLERIRCEVMDEHEDIQYKRLIADKLEESIKVGE